MNNWKITFEVHTTKDGILERRVSEAYAAESSQKKARELFEETLWPQLQTQFGAGAEYRIASVEQKVE